MIIETTIKGIIDGACKSTLVGMAKLALSDETLGRRDPQHNINIIDGNRLLRIVNFDYLRDLCSSFY